ncbi:hypothetical protein ACWESX_34285, partial [Streptomyces sp. NPDC004008]
MVRPASVERRSPAPPERGGGARDHPRPGPRRGPHPHPGGSVSRLRWLTAGESHGPALVATLEGLPAGVPITT